MAAIDDLLRLFAQSILAKVKVLKRMDLTARQRRRLRRSITDDIRTCGALIFPDVTPPEVSQAAHQEAERIQVKICQKGWHNQSRFDRGRKTFHWEHMNPVSSIQVLCEQAESEETILEVLKRRIRIAWILKREDKELTRLGYRSKREDPEAAYLEAGIELLQRPSPERGGNPPE